MTAIVYGTRPEYLKVLPLILSTNYKVIRVLQHENLDEPDLIYHCKLVINQKNTGRLDTIGSQILDGLPNLLIGIKKVIVQGDTATAFYSALSSFQNNIKIIHLEAGLRTYDISSPFPEEGYRQMISRITSLHLVPHSHNQKILQNENVGGKIVCVGNTILDLVKSYNLQTNPGNTVVITFHRRENIANISNFIKNLEECIDLNSDKEFLWMLHPNLDLQNIVKRESLGLNITFINPRMHRDFLDVVKRCFCILTDSGGIQEEAAFLGKPTIVLRSSTERDQIPEPFLYLVPPPYKTLTDTFKKISPNPIGRCFEYGDGNAVSKIIEEINQL